ncbi:MAG: phosphoribosyl-AMP cyclohydrolase [Coriobacteriales bacterium]|nr:phosphoribosyl-AMP cyclohydrolase [Coriobacteriales bacterium]
MADNKNAGGSSFWAKPVPKTPDYSPARMGSYAGERLQHVDLSDLTLKLDSAGLIPAVVQQEETGEVLMVAWMSEESLRLTLETGTTWFWSRSRQELWNKGATSGNMQQVKRVLIDCDADTLVVEVDSPGPACHTGHRSCFYRELIGE